MSEPLLTTPGLVFNEVAHEYHFNGKRVPSVTGILKPLSDFSRVPPNVLEAKRILGSAVHLACEWDDEGELDDERTPGIVMGYVAGWRKFKSDMQVEVLHSEARVFHRTRLYAGTLDRILMMRGRKVPQLIDLKTSAQIMKSVGPQTAGYAAAAEVPGYGRGVLQLKPDGNYKYVELTDPTDWATFAACLTIHNHLSTP
jgi:hypothetical protein